MSLLIIIGGPLPSCAFPGVLSPNVGCNLIALYWTHLKMHKYTPHKTNFKPCGLKQIWRTFLLGAFFHHTPYSSSSNLDLESGDNLKIIESDFFPTDINLFLSVLQPEDVTKLLMGVTPVNVVEKMPSIKLVWRHSLRKCNIVTHGCWNHSNYFYNPPSSSFIGYNPISVAKQFCAYVCRPLSGSKLAVSRGNQKGSVEQQINIKYFICLDWATEIVSCMNTFYI